MNNVVSFSSRDPAVSKQEIVDTLNRLITEHDGLQYFPTNMQIALEQRVWEGERKFVDGTVIPPLTFHDFIHRKYPYGIGANYEIVENMIRDRADVLALWVEVTKRPAGAPLGNRNAAKVEDETTVDNIHDCKPERPSGTSSAAGIRKLQKAASKGNEKAVDGLAAAVEGRKSVHAACVDAGVRKATKIDADVRQRCDRANAERLVEHMPVEMLDPFLADLFAAGHKTLGIAVKNLIGESVMDRRYGDRG